MEFIPGGPIEPRSNCLDEIFGPPQLAGFIERQLRYLDAAVAELRQAL